MLVALTFILGLVIGSFLNVCIYRIPRGESLLHPLYSVCPKCNHRLFPFDLIPLLSFLLLKGKCRYCETQIAYRYFFIELLTGMLFVLAYWYLGLTWSLLSLWFFIALLIIVAFIDLEHQIIPNKVNLFGFVSGVVLNLFTGNLSLLNMLLGFLVSGGLLFLIAVLSRGGMGGGDIKFGAVMGVFLGWQLALLALLIAFVLGGLGGIVLLALKKKGRKDMIPFGPFLVLGSLVSILFGNQILSWYLQTLS